MESVQCGGSSLAMYNYEIDLYPLSLEGGFSVLVTAEKLNRATGLRRSPDSWVHELTAEH